MPQRRKPKTLESAIRYPFLKQTNTLPSTDKIGHDWDNNSELTWASANGLSAIAGLKVDASDRLILGSSAVKSTPKIVKFVMNANAGIVDQAFWISDGTYEVLGASEIHSVAGSDSDPVTLDLQKCVSGIAPGSGDSVLATTFNAKGTAQTLQTVGPSASAGRISIVAGDRIALNVTGVTTALVGVVIELFLAPGYSGNQAIFNMNANASLADQCFFTATKTVKITRIDYVHSTLGTNASAVTVQVTKDVSTDVAGAGTDLLTNNTNAGFNCKAAINVVQNGTLSATPANLILAPGDRLSVDFAGTLTALAGVVIVVTFEPYYKSIDVSYNMLAQASLADGSFFIANRPYKVLYIKEVHGTLGTDGSAVNLQITLDRGTDAPGAGSNLLSNNASAGFDLKATINTVQTGTFADTGLNYMMPGDRLSLDFAGTLTAVAGLQVTVTLEEA